jgi:hypothetical protein
MPILKHRRIRNVCGPAVARFRKLRRLSQEALRVRCHQSGWRVARSVLAKVETRRRAVKDHELLALAQALRVSVSDLVGPPRRPMLR